MGDGLVDEILGHQLVVVQLVAVVGVEEVKLAYLLVVIVYVEEGLVNLFQRFGNFLSAGGAHGSKHE